MLRLALIFAVLGSLLAGTFAWSRRTVGGKADFTFVNRGEIGTLDPNRISWSQDLRVGYALWEGLYTLDPQTLEPIPGAANRIDISADACTYTFYLRPEARWSNGDPVRSGDFVFAWRRMLEQPGDYTYLFHCIRGARQYQQAFAAGESADFSTVGIKIHDDRTVEVTLEHPVVYFPDLCAFAAFWPLHEPSMRPFYDQKTRSYRREFTRPPHLVTNGPYRLASWSFRQKIRLEANDHYWDRVNVRSRTIDMIIAADEMWSFLKYDSRAADWTPDASGAIGAALYQQGRPDMHVFSGFGTYIYKVNTLPRLADGRPNPFCDPRVRKAFSLAIDRQGIVDTITRLGEPTASTFIPPGIFPLYDSPEGPAMDIARARQLLAEAGYPDGRGFPSVTIAYNSEFHHGNVAQYIRRQWLENLNVDVGLEALEIKVFRQRLHTTRYAIARSSWMGDYNDPSTFLECYLSNSDNNDTGWSNARFDQLIHQAAREADNTRRMAMFREAEEILLQEQPIIPLYHYVNALLYRDNVKGLPNNARNTVLLKHVFVEPERQ